MVNSGNKGEDRIMTKSPDKREEKSPTKRRDKGELQFAPVAPAAPNTSPSLASLQIPPKQNP